MTIQDDYVKRKHAGTQKACREANKEQIREKRKQYYEANKEKISAYNRQYRELKKRGLNG